MKNSLTKLTLSFFLLSGFGFSVATADIELPPITVKAPSGNSNGWVTICTGNQCADMFNSSILNSWNEDFNAEMGELIDELVTILSVENVPDNHQNNEPIDSCSAALPLRLNHAQKDMASKWISYKIGRVYRIKYSNNLTELWIKVASHGSASLVNIPGSCG